MILQVITKPMRTFLIKKLEQKCATFVFFKKMSESVEEDSKDDIKPDETQLPRKR